MKKSWIGLSLALLFVGAFTVGRVHRADAAGNCSPVWKDCTSGQPTAIGGLTMPYVASSSTIVAGYGIQLTTGTSTVTATSASLVSTPKVTVTGVTEAMMSLSDNTTANVSTSAHGLAPKCPGGTTFWRADCTWAEAGGSGGGPELDRIVAAYQAGWRWFYPRYQSIQNWRAMGVLGSSVYASVSNGDIYKQSGGTGNFVALGQTARNWTAFASCGADMLAFVYGGDVYRQTGGTGNFVAMSQTSRNWNAATTVGTNVYALEYGGTLYKLTNCTGNFVATGGVAHRSYYGLASIGSTLYASTYSTGDIFVRTDGDGADFGAMAQVSRDYRQMTSDGTNIYVAVWGGEPCVLLNGAGPAFPMGQVTRNWHNIVYNGARLYASGYGTDIFTTF